MASVHVHVDNFNAGEISPLVVSRLGVEKVVNGCRRLRNMILHAHGPAFRRPGTQDMGAAASNSSASRVYSFQFSASTVFVLEFSAAVMRVWQNGALVSLLAPVVTPYTAAQLPALHFSQVNDVVYITHPDHEPRRLTRYADNNWVLEVFPWLWPALGDENPVEAVSFTTSLAATFNSIGGTSSTWTEASPGALAITGTPVSGPHRIVLEEEVTPGVWREVADFSWTDTVAIPAIPWNNGTVTNLRRITIWGHRTVSGSSTWAVTIGGTQRLIATTPSPAPSTITAPAGVVRISVSSVAQSGDALRSLVLQYRVGAGTWATFRSYDTTAIARDYFEHILTVATEFRWCNDGSANATGSNTALIESGAPSSVAQTAISISDPTVGSGRTLSASRSLFLPTHVGAYWQITHRREDAFVEIVSTSAAVAAHGTLTFTAISVANQTVTIGNRTYTWVATAAAVANTIDLGASATDSRDNMIAAINGAAGGGTLYGSTTAPHADVTAAAGPTGTSIIITARTPGTGAHSIAITDTMSNAAWDDVFLHSGVDANTVISAAETAGLRIQGKWSVSTYGSWATTLYLERQTVAGTWEYVRSWRSNKDREVLETDVTDGDEILRLRVIAGTSSEASGAASPRFVLEAADARTDGLVKITAVGSLDGSGKAVSATCTVIQACFNTSPSYAWTEGAFSDANGYPRSVTLHEQRLWFGGTKKEPMRLWGSVIGDIQNFRRTSLDDGSVSFTPTAGELNPIQWLQSQGAQLLIGTLGDEWSLSGEGQPITPTNFQFRRESRFGSAPVAAVLAGEVVVFAQRGGRKVRRIAARSDNETWATADMTILAEHVALEGIREMAFGSNPNSILWAVTNDGKLLGMTLEVEQNVFGWHVHETDGTIESVAVVYGEDADEVWLSVLRGTQRRIERLDPLVFSRDWANYATMIYADCAKRYDGVPVSSISGLSHLNGKTVTVLADGAVHPTRVVSGGSITLQAPASKVIVGLPFTSELQPSRREVQTERGTSQGKLWKLSRVIAWVHESRGGKVAEAVTGSVFETLPYTGTGLYSGDIETAVESTARTSVDVTIKTSDPLPLNVGALVLKLDLYGE